MKIGYLGAGSWGFCLAVLLARKGFDVTLWSNQPERVEQLKTKGEHPFFPGIPLPSSLIPTSSLDEALEGVDCIVESVTSAGLRPVFQAVKERMGFFSCPIVITSKGIEQGTGLILPDVVIEILGESCRQHVGVLSGPSFAEDVIRQVPTSVVGACGVEETRNAICHLFHTPYFRVYPNSDLMGVAYGGALKNIIAIACGIGEGLGFGASSRAALMTRGLHEMRKLAIRRGAHSETLNGLSGMGDLCLTCSSTMSRNFRYGLYLAQGEAPEGAKQHVGMVVEGAYTALSALELSRQLDVPMPITQLVHSIIYEKMPPQDAVKRLMEREVKEEHL